MFSMGALIVAEKLELTRVLSSILFPFIWLNLIGAKAGEPGHLNSPFAMRTQGGTPQRSHHAAELSIHDRRDLKPARSSSESSFGCSNAAKCPPFGSRL